MELLNVTEYKEISCVYVPHMASDEKLTKLINKAVKVFHKETKRAYTEDVHEKSPVWVKESVKDSLVALVDYYLESNSTTLYGKETTPSSLSVGKTTVSFSNSKNINTSQTVRVLPFEFYQALGDTGLLYKGVQ